MVTVKIDFPDQELADRWLAFWHNEGDQTFYQCEEDQGEETNYTFEGSGNHLKVKYIKEEN